MISRFGSHFPYCSNMELSSIVIANDCLGFLVMAVSNFLEKREA